MKGIFKEKKGITLIALVITIIVLLILAGVSIAMLTGQNGILTQAQSAKTVTSKEGAREKLNIILNSLQAEKIPKGENLELGDDLAYEIAEFDEVTSARFTGKKIETVIDGYTFDVDANLKIDDKKEVEKVEPENIDDWDWQVEDDGTARLVQYNGNDTKLIIPNYINGYWVKTVGGVSRKKEGDYRSICSIFDLNKCKLYNNATNWYAFVESNINEIVISEGIEVIEEEAFEDAINLRKVSIPGTVYEIGSHTFYLGGGLSEYGLHREKFTLNIPSNVINLGGFIVGPDDIINVEFTEDEIPTTWSENWNIEGTVNYGVNM